MATTSFLFFLFFAAAASLPCRIRGARSRACSNFSAVLSEHEAGSWSTTARERKRSSRKCRKDHARRRSKAISGRRRRRRFSPQQGRFCFSFWLYPKSSPKHRASLPPNLILPPNLRFTPPALAARSCSRAACDVAWEAGSCSWVVSDAAAARGDRLLKDEEEETALNFDEEENAGVAGLVVDAALDVATPPRAAMRVAMSGPPRAVNARSGGCGKCVRGGDTENSLRLNLDL